MRLFETYRGMLEEDPYQAYALRRLLEVSHVQGGLAGLAADYEARVKVARVRSADWVILGHIYAASDRHTDALKAYGEAVTLSPKDWRPQRARARLFRTEQRWDSSLKAYDLAIARVRAKADRLELWQEAADAALEGKRLEHAQSLYAAMIAAEPRKHFLHMEAAATLARRGFPKAALSAWQTVEKSVGRVLKHQVVLWRQIAALQEELGDLSAAEATWRKGLSALSTAHWARPAFLEGLVSVYRRRDALPTLVKELGSGKVRDRPTQLVLAYLCEEMGDDPCARRWLGRALAKDPRDVPARLRLIAILERTGPSEALIAAHEALVKISRGEPRHELNLAALYFRKDMASRGFKLLDRLGRRYRSDPGVHQRIIDLTMRYGDDKERPRIERTYRTLMRLEPKEEGHVISLGEYWWSSGDRRKAQQAWRRLRSMGSGPGQGELAHAEVLYDHGLVTEAKEAFEDALLKAPKNPRILRVYARFLEQEKKTTEALVIWGRVLEVERGATKSAEARRRVVELWRRGGQIASQRRALEKRFGAEPPELEAGFLLVEVLLNARDLDAVQKVLERLRALAPERLETLTALERLYVRKERVSDAIEVLETLARLNPREAYHYLHRAADLALARGDVKGALETTRRVVALNPADPSAHERVGDLFRRMERMEEAAAAWRQVLLLNPRNDPVRFKLADLYRALDQPERERQELIHIVRETSQPADALKAGRRLLQVAIATRGLRDVEDALRPLSSRRAGRSDVYLKLLIDVYVASVRALRWSTVTDVERRTSLEALGERALRPLLSALSGADVALRARALEVIRATHPPGAVPALSRLLESPSSAARISIAAALGSIGTPSAVVALRRLFDRGGGDAQRVAIWSLGLAESSEALDELITISGSAYPHHRILAAWAMGRQGNPRSLEALMKIQRSADQRQRLAATWALAMLGTSAAEAALQSGLSSTNLVERRLAGHGLAALETPSAQRRLIGSLWRADDQPSGHLGEALTGGALPNRRADVDAAYLALADTLRGRLKEDTSLLVSTLLRAPASTTERVQRVQHLLPLIEVRVATVMGEGIVEEVERLLSSCLDPTGRLRLAPLVPALADQGELKVMLDALWAAHLPALLKVAQGSLGRSLRAPALRLLSHLELTGHLNGALAQAQDALQSPWTEVQAAALSLLSRSHGEPDPARVDALVAYLRTWSAEGPRDPLVRAALAETFGALGRIATSLGAIHERLRALMNDPVTGVRLAAVEAAARLDSEDLLSALADRVSDPVGEVSRCAMGALTRSAHDEAQELLSRLTGTPLYPPQGLSEPHDSSASP